MHSIQPILATTTPLARAPNAPKHAHSSPSLPLPPSLHPPFHPLAGPDHDVMVLERLNWKPTAYLTGGHSGPVRVVAFSPNGEGVVLLWLCVLSVSTCVTPRHPPHSRSHIHTLLHMQVCMLPLVVMTARWWCGACQRCVCVVCGAVCCAHLCVLGVCESVC